MRYLITGGLGVVGSLLAIDLVRSGHQVSIIDKGGDARHGFTTMRLCGEGHGRVDPKDVCCARIETMKVENLAAIIASCDAVIHAAAHTGIPHSAEAVDDDWASNVDATKRLLDALRLEPRPTVLMSSVKPYRVHDWPVVKVGCRYEWKHLVLGVNENVVLEPDEPYAASKMAQSALGMAYARSFGLPVTVLRFSNLYGPAPCHGPRHGWMTWFCISAALGVPLHIQGNGMQVRDLLYSTDINTALLAAIKNIDKTHGNVYNVGGGGSCGGKMTTSVNEAVDLMRELNPDIPVEMSEGRKHEDPVFITDYTKFKNATGWSPQTTVRHGADKIYEWARKNSEDLRKVYAPCL